MRFFAHDGKSTHGPAGIEELLKLPGFDGDTLVCPVGSDDSSDWKPALAYAQFKKALLEAPAAAAPAPASPPAPAAPPEDLPKQNQIPVPAPFPLPLPASPAPAATPGLPPLPAAAPLPLPVAPLPLPAAPAPAAKTLPCPRCTHANLDEARFCNSCGARMDGKTDAVSAPPPADLQPVPPPAEAPKTSEALVPVEAPKPFEPAMDPGLPVDAPKDDPFSRLDPLLSYPTDPAPMGPPDSPRRPLQPGKMGQLAAFEEASPADAHPAAPAAPPLAPEPVTGAATVPVWKKPAVIAAFAGAAVLAGGIGYMMLPKAVPVETVAELTPGAPQAAPEPAEAAAPVIYSPPPATSSPSMPPPSAAKSAKPPKPSKPAGTLSSAAPAPPKPRRARKPRPVRAPKPEPVPDATPAEEPGGGDTFIESRAPEPRSAAKASAKDPLLEALLSNATQPSSESGSEPLAEPGAAPARKAAEKAPPTIGQRPASKPSQFSLPGLKRPVSASDRAAASAVRAPEAVAEGSPQTSIAGLGSAPLAEPGRSSPPPGIEDEPAKAADGAGTEGDQLALVQVHEQFDFCAQLLAQGAFGDHYDTCLCKDTREAAPYRGRRGYYVSARKKEAGSGRLESSAKILSSKIEGGVAMVTARWKSGAEDKGRTSTQNWKLEDGLWCQAP